MCYRRKTNLYDLEMESEFPYGRRSGGKSSENEVKFEDIPVGEVHHPKDPRSKAKYNIFSRLLLW